MREWLMESTYSFAQSPPEFALWPVGTVEAHGPWPLGTDVLAPEAMARELASRLDFILLPTLPFGITNSLMGWPGSLTLSPETFGALVFEILESVVRWGLKGVVVLNGHGGNTQVLAEAGRRALHRLRLRVAVVDWWEPVRPGLAELLGQEGFGHAALDETAGLLAFYPDVKPRGSKDHYAYPKGTKAYPPPKSMLTYDGTRPDFSRLTPERLTRVRELILDTLESVIREIVEGWRAIGSW